MSHLPLSLMIGSSKPSLLFSNFPKKCPISMASVVDSVINLNYYLFAEWLFSSFRAEERLAEMK